MPFCRCPSLRITCRPPPSVWGCFARVWFCVRGAGAVSCTWGCLRRFASGIIESGRPMPALHSGATRFKADDLQDRRTSIDVRRSCGSYVQDLPPYDYVQDRRTSTFKRDTVQGPYIRSRPTPSSIPRPIPILRLPSPTAAASPRLKYVPIVTFSQLCSSHRPSTRSSLSRARLRQCPSLYRTSPPADLARHHVPTYRYVCHAFGCSPAMLNCSGSNLHACCSRRLPPSKRVLQSRPCLRTAPS